MTQQMPQTAVTNVTPVPPIPLEFMHDGVIIEPEEDPKIIKQKLPPNPYNDEKSIELNRSYNDFHPFDAGEYVDLHPAYDKELRIVNMPTHNKEELGKLRK